MEKVNIEHAARDVPQKLGLQILLSQSRILAKFIRETYALYLTSAEVGKIIAVGLLHLLW